MNIPDIKRVGGKLLAIVWSMDSNEGKGCNWRVTDLDGNVISYGFSNGLGGDGCGSRLTAMDNARRAAKRALKKL